MSEAGGGDQPVRRIGIEIEVPEIQAHIYADRPIPRLARVRAVHAP